MYRNPNVQKQVAGSELSELAHKIAQRDCISFGDALFKARREIEFADTVQQNTGSPLRDQTQSTTPNPSAVREAVVAGLSAAPIWNQGNLNLNGIVRATGEASTRLAALGLGPQIISSLTAELSAWLNNNNVNGSFPSDVISKAGDHMQQIYADALANKTATQVWSEQGTIQTLNGGYVPVDMESANLAERATQIAQRRGISFGEALRMARRDDVEFADDVIDSQKLTDALAQSLKSAFGTIFSGAQQKIIGASDALNIAEQADKALRALGMGGATSAVTKAVEAALNGIRGVTQVGAVDGIIEKVTAAAQKAYAQAINS
jgi:hypothetical protein